MGGIQVYQTTNPNAPNYYSGGPSRVTGADIKTATDAGNLTRQQGQLNFNQNLSNFGTFMDKYFPQATGNSVSLSSTGAGGNGVGAGGPITQVPGMGTVGTWTPNATPPMPTLPSPQSSSGAAFARAKDQVGSSLSGLMKALGDQFSSRGIGSSATAGNTIADALVRGEGQLGDVAREQAMADTNTANEFAKTGFTGALEGRGQDIGALEAARSAALGERGQDVSMRGQDLSAEAERARLNLQAQQDRLASITGLWRAFTNGNGGSALY